MKNYNHYKALTKNADWRGLCEMNNVNFDSFGTKKELKALKNYLGENEVVFAIASGVMRQTETSNKFDSGVNTWLVVLTSERFLFLDAALLTSSIDFQSVRLDKVQAISASQGFLFGKISIDLGSRLIVVDNCLKEGVKAMTELANRWLAAKEQGFIPSADDLEQEEECNKQDFVKAPVLNKSKAKNKSKKVSCGCLIVFFLIMIVATIFSESTETTQIESNSTSKHPFYSLKEVKFSEDFKLKVDENFAKWTRQWYVEGAEYKITKDKNSGSLKMVIMFKGKDLPTNIEKFLERISENIAFEKSDFIVECILEENPSLVLQQLEWKNSLIYKVFAIKNPIAQNIENDNKRLEQARRSNIRLTFKNTLSLWDGSLNSLVIAVKETMHNPNSFEHVKTVFAVKSFDGNGEILVSMTFRGSNMYGAIVTQTVQAICTPNGKILNILEE